MPFSGLRPLRGIPKGRISKIAEGEYPIQYLVELQMADDRIVHFWRFSFVFNMRCSFQEFGHMSLDNVIVIQQLESQKTQMKLRSSNCHVVFF